MAFLIFDTETTGLYPGNICQLSYLICNNNTITAKNYFFKVRYIEPESKAIHGLTIDKLNVLSNNNIFSNYAHEIKNDFTSAHILIAHNYEFDVKFLYTEFIRCRQKIQHSYGFCTTKYFTPICKIKGKRKEYKRPKLEELVKFLKVDNNEIIRTTTKIFDITNTTYHDARFDAVATYLCYIKAMEYGYITTNHNIV